MGPKVEAATSFATKTGHPAVIGRLEDALAIVQEQAGTRIEAGDGALEFAVG